MSYSVIKQKYLMKQKSKADAVPKVDKSGDWEFYFDKPPRDPNFEAKTKVSMKPNNGFNPKDIHHYINPTPSKEELLLVKKNAGEKLNTKEKIIVDNYISKKMIAIKNDIDDIKNFGLAAQPSTKEGKTRLLLYMLNIQLEKNNNELVANLYLRLMEDQFEITPELRKEYNEQLQKMDNIISTLNMVELQFTKFHSQMPPLHLKGFNKFDDWQIQVVSNIDNNITTVVNAPTSAGKSVLSGYATTKGDTLFVVPTDALAWQMSAYIGNIIGMNVPIITSTYQTIPRKDELLELLNKATAIVGTAENIVDYLPFLKNKFKWIIFDEIHMIGKPEGSAMEHIAKILYDVPKLALSATIGNTDELVEWFQRISPHQKVEKVICDKRFFNLQRSYYDTMKDELITLHPLALIEEQQIDDGSIMNNNLQPTPPNAWDLAMNIKSKIELGNLDPNIYFRDNNRIELDQATKYFYDLIQFLVDTYKTQPEIVQNIISVYKNEELMGSNVCLVKLAFKLKEQDKLPAIIFQKNTISCLRLTREFAKTIERMEEEKYPKLIEDRLKLTKIAKRKDNKIEEDLKFDDSKSKKAMKEFTGSISLKKDSYGTSSIGVKQEDVTPPSLQEPHLDFIMTPTQYFSEGMIEEWVQDLRKFFPNTGDYYHYIIKLLWRGVGVYAKGLPDYYLRLVQTLACQKKLGVVFSDMSLVFGVSMPFRTVVIVKDDTLDSMLFHQMSGRAGRRGLDKEGNIVFAGYSWERIKELSISRVPIVKGVNNPVYTIPHASMISNLSGSHQNWDMVCRNYLDQDISDTDAKEFLDDLKSNYEAGWKFAFDKTSINHLYMNWKFRYDDNCIIASYLIPYLRRAFEDKDHTKELNQISLAHFLCHFFEVKEAPTELDAMETMSLFLQDPYNMIANDMMDLQVDLPKLIDNKLFISIQSNTLIKCETEEMDDILRNRLMAFGEKIKKIQHYCHHSKIVGLSRLMGKLLTRIWWIYHMSSPIMKSLNEYEL